MVQSFDPGDAGQSDFLAFAAAIGAPSAGTDVITMYALEATIRPHLEAIT